MGSIDFDAETARKLQKPRPGAYRLKQQSDKAMLRTDEAKHKKRAKARDGHVCRAPHASQAEYDECRRLRVESAHLTHKGMGSDPSGERSIPELMVTLGLRCHRERLDGRQPEGPTLRPKFLTPDRANGVLAWEVKRGDRWFLVHVERRIGDANEQWRRR